MNNTGNNKQPQKIRGCFFPLHRIPNTFAEYKQLYKGEVIYAGYKGKELENEMKADFEKLNGQTKESDTNIEKTTSESITD